jgi:hypothetical protein
VIDIMHYFSVSNPKAMNRLILLIFICAGLFLQSSAQKAKPDTVKVGVYVTSIHNIDFKQKEYAVQLWLWLKYKNKNFSFDKYLEIPMAKSVDRSFYTADTSNEEVYMLMKLQCVMRDSWKIANFPFDRQTLRFSIENSQYDSHSLVFVPDTAGQHYDRRFALNGWNIDSCILSASPKIYETGFGDESLSKPRTEYSAFRLRLSITRSAGGLFWKLFLGMYIAFLIAYVCFYIHADGMDSRFSLSVGSLFAVIGNKYIVDSSLPESTSFTLVDTLHGLTLFCILVIISATAYSLVLIKRNQIKKATRFDMITAQVVLFLYVVANIYFIVRASAGN